MNCSVLKFLTGGLSHYRLNKAAYSFEIVPVVIFIITAIIIIYNIYVLVENKYQKIIALSIFILGLGSRMIMGFSPTVWASGYRTFCIMFVSFIYIALIIFFAKNTASNNNVLYVINNTKQKRR